MVGLTLSRAGLFLFLFSLTSSFFVTYVIELTCVIIRKFQQGSDGMEFVKSADVVVLVAAL